MCTFDSIPILDSHMQEFGPAFAFNYRTFHVFVFSHFVLFHFVVDCELWAREKQTEGKMHFNLHDGI